MCGVAANVGHKQYQGKMTGFSLSPNWTTLKLHCPWFFYISSRLLCTYVSGSTGYEVFNCVIQSWNDFVLGILNLLNENSDVYHLTGSKVLKKGGILFFDFCNIGFILFSHSIIWKSNVDFLKFVIHCKNKFNKTGLMLLYIVSYYMYLSCNIL